MPSLPSRTRVMQSQHHTQGVEGPSSSSVGGGSGKYGVMEKAYADASRVAGAQVDFISSLLHTRAEGARRLSSMVPELRRELKSLLRSTEVHERRYLRSRDRMSRGREWLSSREGPRTPPAPAAEEQPRPWSESQAEEKVRPRPTTRSSGRASAPGKSGGQGGRKMFPRPIGHVKQPRADSAVGPNDKRKWSVNVAYAHGARELLTRTASELGWSVVREPGAWSSLYWTINNSEVRNLELAGIGPGCVVNRLIGATGALSKKVPLSQLFQILQDMMPDGRYCFYPRAWFTDDSGLEQLRKDVPELTPLICKPDSGSQGRGIWLATGPKEVSDGIREEHLRRIRRSKPLEEYIVQEYIDRPLLLDGRKFDLRIYVLVLDVGSELRAFISREGMARFCNDKYEPLVGEHGAARDDGPQGGFDMSGWSADVGFAEATTEEVRGRRDEQLYGKGSRPLSRPSTRGTLDASRPSKRGTLDASRPSTRGTLDASRPSTRGHDARTSHLTNTSLNKKHEGWQNGGNIMSDDAGGKRTLSAVLSRLNIDGVIAEGEFWRKLHTLVRHTLQGIRSSLRFEEFSTHSKSSSYYRAQGSGNDEEGSDGATRGTHLPAHGCFQYRFQVLGLDVILDEHAELHLLEINSNPSLSLDAVYDLVHKGDPSASSSTTAASLVPPCLSMTRESTILRMGESASAFLDQVARERGAGVARAAPEPQYLPVDAQRIMQYNRIPWMGEDSVCRCKASCAPHVHLPGPIDEHIKIQSMQGALKIVQRAVDLESNPDVVTPGRSRNVRDLCHGVDYEEVANLTPDPTDYSSDARHLNTLDTVSYMLRAAIDSRGRLSCSSLLRLLNALDVPIDSSTIDIFFQKHFSGRGHIYASSVNFIQWLHCVLDAAVQLADTSSRERRGRPSGPREDVAGGRNLSAREESTQRLLAKRDIYRRTTQSHARHKTRPSFLNGAGRALEAMCLKFLATPIGQQLGLPGGDLWLVSPTVSPDPFS